MMIDRLTDKEALQLALNGLHSQAKNNDWHHRKDIRDEVSRCWPATEALIINLQTREQRKSAVA